MITPKTQEYVKQILSLGDLTIAEAIEGCLIAASVLANAPLSETFVAQTMNELWRLSRDNKH